MMRTLLTKARIRTMDEGRPKAEALVIEGGRIVAIGSAAGMAALDGFAARAASCPWPSLHRIAHCQRVHPDDWPRFRNLGVMANFRPIWATTAPIIPDDTMDMIGPERALWTYAMRSAIDAGAPCCINSD